MPNRNKEKGDRAERQVVQALMEIPGVLAKKIPQPLQATTESELEGDVLAKIGPCGLFEFEVKSRKNDRGFGQIIKWIGSKDALALKLAGSRHPLMVLPWETFRVLLEAAAKATEGVSRVPGSYDDHADSVLETLGRGTTRSCSGIRYRDGHATGCECTELFPQSDGCPHCDERTHEVGGES